tara:strand:+ start:1252 stop:2403 length:1152 start_codon:yes stop_codon:yes gene_type:complete
MAIEDPDIEILVSDNASLDNTREVMSEVTDPRVRYVNTGQRLSMRQNFEFAFHQSTGDYVIYFGDDDGIVPGQFPFLRRLLEDHRPDALSWDFPVYGWPVEGYGHRVGGLRLAKGHVFGRPHLLDLEQRRRVAENGRLDLFHPMPAIYHGCMSREFLARLARDDGTVFLARSPDTFVNFRAIQHGGKFLHCNHPFSINGHSPASNGGNLNAQGTRSEKQDLANRFSEEMKTDPIDDVVPLTKSVPFGFLGTLETVRALFPDPAMTPNYKSWYLGILLDIRKKDLETQRELLSMLSDLARQTGTENALKAAKSPMAKYLRKLSMVWTKNRSKLRSFRVSAEIDGENTILTAAKTCDRLLQQDFEPILNKGISREQGWVRVRGRQ